METRPVVLWFVNKPVSLDEFGANEQAAGKGWLATLAAVVMETCELHICAVDPYKQEEKGAITTHFVRPKWWKLKMLVNSLYPLFQPSSNLIPQAMAVVQRVKPDIIHIHGSEQEWIKLAYELRDHKIKIVLSLQGVMSVIAKKYTVTYSAWFQRTTIFDFGGQISALLPRTNAHKLRAVLKAAAIEDQYAPYINYFTGRTTWDKSISKLWNPTSTYFQDDRLLKPVFWEYQWSDLPQGGTIKLFTTTSDSVFKGFEVIAEAAYLLERAGFKVEWTLAGINASSAVVRLVKRRLKARYPKGLVFLGKVGATVIAEAMIKSHVYVMGSHIENSPNNLAEAQLVGMPCVATDVGGTSSYLQHEVSGLLIPSGDAYAMAGAVERLFNDRSLAQALAAEAQKVARERHHVERVKAQIEATYNHLLNDKG